MDRQSPRPSAVEVVRTVRVLYESTTVTNGRRQKWTSQDAHLHVVDQQMMLAVDLMKGLSQILVFDIAQFNARKYILQQTIEPFRVTEREFGQRVDARCLNDQLRFILG